MNFLIFSDVHISTKTIDMVEAAFEQMVKYSRQHDIHSWLCCGDWFERQEDEKYDIIHRALHTLGTITNEHNINIRTIKGNHDKNSWKLLQKAQICVIPDGSSVDHENKIVLCHYVPREADKYVGDKAWPIDSFEKEKMYFCGHWHYPVPVKASNIILVGSLVPDKFGLLDRLYRCRFLHYTQGSLQNIKSIHTNVSGKFTLSYNYWLKYLKEGAITKQDSIRLICTNKTETDSAADLVKKESLVNVKIVPVFTNAGGEPSPKPDKTNPAKMMTIEDLICMYAKKNNLDASLPLKVFREAR